MEENTDIYLSEEETRQKKRETAQWIMEIVRHLLIAAYDIDGDVKNSTINFWRTEGLGFTGGPSDEEAREHIAEAYYGLQCENRPGSIEDIRDSTCQLLVTEVTSMWTRGAVFSAKVRRTSCPDTARLAASPQGCCRGQPVRGRLPWRVAMPGGARCSMLFIYRTLRALASMFFAAFVSRL